MTIEEEKDALEESHRQKLNALLDGETDSRNWRKERAFWSSENRLMTTSPRLKITSDQVLQSGEFWFVQRYEDGLWKSPAPSGSSESKLFPNPEYRSSISSDSSKFLSEQLKKCVENIERGYLPSLDKSGPIPGGEYSKGAMDAIQSRNFLNDALSQVTEYFKDPPPTEVMQAMERAFRAGRYAAECDHEMTKKRATETFETKSNQFTGGERSTDLSKQPDAIRGAIAFQKKYTASTQEEVLAYLHDQGATIPRKTGLKLRIRGEKEWITKESFFRRVNRYK
jgi:hypothetical protein